MEHTITFTVEALLFWAGVFGVVCATIVWIKKGTEPILRPFREIQELKEQKHICDNKFANDDKRLDKVEEMLKMVVKSQMLLLKHIETGNCTGEVAAGRKELEDYLINKE